MDDDEKRAVLAEFDRLVTMSPAELERWLDSPESREVGMTREGEHDSVGHQSGRRIVAIRRKRRDELSDDDLAHMRKVIGYIHRHTAQGGPKDDKEHSRWRYSLMNWGHDPMT